MKRGNPNPPEQGRAVRPRLVPVSAPIQGPAGTAQGGGTAASLPQNPPAAAQDNPLLSQFRLDQPLGPQIRQQRLSPPRGSQLAQPPSQPQPSQLELSQPQLSPALEVQDSQPRVTPPSDLQLAQPQEAEPIQSQATGPSLSQKPLPRSQPVESQPSRARETPASPLQLSQPREAEPSQELQISLPRPSQIQELQEEDLADAVTHSLAEGGELQ